MNKPASTTQNRTASSAPPAELPIVGGQIEYTKFLDCVHCGLCTSACPTYLETGDENNSPRGRIYLMRSVVDGRLELTDTVQRHLDLCLDCRACTTACPSGVKAGEVMEVCRSQAHQFFPAGHLSTGFRRFLLERMLPDPDRLEIGMLPARLYQRLGIQWLVRHSHLLKLGPDWMAKAEGMLPQLDAPLRNRLPEVTPAGGEPRAEQLNVLLMS